MFEVLIHSLQFHPILSTISYRFGDESERLNIQTKHGGFLMPADVVAVNDFASIPSFTKVDMIIPTVQHTRPLIIPVRNLDGVRVVDILDALVTE